MRTVPASTYRLQLHANFTFDDAAAIAPYLSALGVSHVYSSPYLQAAPGSMHGYDVVDHQHVNDELGGAAGHARFSKTLGEHGLGQVLDIVPNHMAVDQGNRYWWDILENGASSRYAPYFDIDWNPQEERLKDKVLVPILGDQYGRVLEAGGIVLRRSGSEFRVEAGGQEFPLAPTSIPLVLIRAGREKESDPLAFIAASYLRLPGATYLDRPSVLARHRDKLVIHRVLERYCAEQPEVGEAIDRAVAAINADKDALDELLNQQNYRLAYWKTADQQLGYRRFFDVNNLIGLRMERLDVFAETHVLLLEWLKLGVIDGVRVDHPDGLRDPLEYFGRLRAAAPKAWILGEKILAAGEFLRKDWPIDGTTGYDFLNMVNGLLVAPEGLAALTKIYGDFTGQPLSFPAIAHDKKLAVTQEALGSDVNRLTTLFVNICECNRNQRDSTRTDIRRAIRELAACFSVYRTYVFAGQPSSLGVRARAAEVTDEDRDVIHRAVACARGNRSDIDGSLFDFMEQVLTLEIKGKQEAEFVLRFQQFTSPVMAKGVEDTAFYCYNRLTSLNEVGADPGKDGVSPAEFFAYQMRMQQTHPQSMTTLSTHDTKRADDVRARLAVLSEVPEEFGAALSRWAKANEKYKSAGQPDRNTEYFLYQTLLGAWPIDPYRTKAYLQKAMREAKQQTTWVSNNQQYEAALNDFIDALLGDAWFVGEMESFVARLQTAGRVNSLTQTLLKHTCPGVPDLYQGGELWDHSLVDPDNRRAVDYGLRTQLLRELESLHVDEIMARMEEGLPKLHVVSTALRLRKSRPELFGPASGFRPVEAHGTGAAHVVAYLRGEQLLTVGQIRTVGLVWGDTAVALPAGEWDELLSGTTFRGGGMVQVSELLGRFPVALLVLR